MEKNSLNIGFIGAGKVGTAFGLYLRQNGFKLSGYYSKSYSSTQKAASLTSSKAAKNIEEISMVSDILFITTKDDEISKVCSLLARENKLKANAIVAHMSGALTSEILFSAKEKGCSVFSLHPLQAFADIESGVAELKNTVFSIEGDENRKEEIQNILKDTGNDYFMIKADKKAIYHSAACVASNYFVTLIDQAAVLLKSLEVDEAVALKAIYHLTEGTLKNIKEFGTKKALTGPIVRGDSLTIERHLEALSKYNLSNLEFYKFMGIETVNFAEREALCDVRKLELIRERLKGE